MKKIYITISTLLLCGSMLMAQTPANRTAKTVTADVLAQMPAERQAEYNKLIGELSSVGEEAVLNLVSKINAPGKGSNSQVEYALSGLSHFVMAQGKEDARLVVSNAYVKALDQVQDNEIKSFIISQLRIVGKAEAVDALSAYLADPYLSSAAARALSSNGSAEAGAALKAGLLRRMGTPETQKNIIEAIAEIRLDGVEDILIPMLQNGDADMKKVVLYALSRTGSEKSLDVVGKAAEAAGYTMEPTGATEAYIALIKNLAAKGEIKVAEKAANTLMKKATKAQQVHAREAALEILMSVKETEDATKLLLAAMKDANKQYRNAALNFASSFINQEGYIELAKYMVKAKPEPKVDILNWFGREAKCPKKHDVIKNLMLRFDLSFAQVLTQQLNNEDFAVQQAAAWTMVKIGDKGYIQTLANLLTSDNKQVVLLAQDALLAFPGDINGDVASAIGKAQSLGKIAGVELLAARMADSKINTVLEQTKSPDAAVKMAAYTALKSVATAQDFTQLCGMLESAESNYVAPMQDAVIASVLAMPKNQQVESLKRRMLQAGSEKSVLYYKVLSATDDKEAFATILEGLNSGSSAAKSAAFEALLQWKGIEAAEQLFAVCKKSASGDMFNKALDRYVQLVSNPEFTGENRLLSLRKAMEIAKTGDQKVKILKQIQQAGTFLSLMYSSEFLDDSDKAVRSAAAYSVWNIARNHKEYTGDNVKALLNKILPMLDGEDARYDIDALKQHLAEMPDEVGFVSMFNGKDLTGWKGLVENPIARAKMKPAQLAKAQEKADEQMRKDWKVEDGCLVFEGSGFDNLCTEKQYGDFEMYVDWMLDPAGPEADAGVYLRGTPQVQIWDTARVDVGAQVGSGGLYNNQKNESKPSKVADNKLGEWNSFYIKMVGDRVTVVLNGEKVVDNVIMENYWDRKQPIFPVEQIELQAHGSKCSFRNLYIKELKRQEPFQLSEQEKKEGFKVLFDGTNMHEWQGNTTDYILEDGCISMVPSKSFGGNLYTKNEYANFIYRFEFQLTPGANNGIGLRTPMGVDAAYHGMESQILDCEHQIYSDITPYQHHGSIYGIIKANENHKKAIKPVGEWNEEEIICDGDNIKVTVNGVVIVEGNIRDAVKNGTPDGKEHPGLFNKKGYIGFLGHGSPVKFRNIRIKELK